MSHPSVLIASSTQACGLCDEGGRRRCINARRAVLHAGVLGDRVRTCTIAPAINSDRRADAHPPDTPHLTKVVPYCGTASRVSNVRVEMRALSRQGSVRAIASEMSFYIVVRSHGALSMREAPRQTG